MRKLLTIIILAIVAVLFALCAKSATVTFAVTNSLGNPDTNTIIIYPISSYINADGSIQTTGLPTKLPVTNGISAINLLNGNYLATNSTICSQYAGPGQIGTQLGIIFAVPASPGTYPIGLLAISGYNVFNYSGATLTNSVSFNSISNALGFIPFTPQQTTNAILANSTASNNIILGQKVYGTNNNPIASFVGVDTNGLAASNSIVPAVLIGPLPSYLTNGLATTNYANSVTNGMTSIVYSNPAAFTTPPQATNIATGAALAMGLSDTNFTIGATNGLNTILTTAIQGTNAALYAALGASNAVQAANITTATNNLSNVKQPGSGILTNLAVTGAYTNSLAGGTNVNLTTNLTTQVVSINATNQTFLTNGLVQWTGLQPTAFLLTNVLPGLTNGYLTQNSITGFISSATAAATYYPTSNPSGFVTSAITNGITTGLYPSSNPSNFITGSSLAAYPNTNQMMSSIQSSNSFLPTFANLSATNTANLTITTNLVQSATNGTFTYIQNYADTNGAGLAAAKAATNNLLANYATTNQNNAWYDYAGSALVQYYNAVQTSTNFATTNTSAQINTALGNFSSTNNAPFVSTNAGQVNALTINQTMQFGADTNFILGTNWITVKGAGSGQANGVYNQIFPGVYTNNSFAGVSIVNSGGIYSILNTNGQTLYLTNTVNGFWLVGAFGSAPKPYVAYSPTMDPILLGNIYATNITSQTLALINQYITNPTNGVSPASASNIVLHYGSTLYDGIGVGTTTNFSNISQTATNVIIAIAGTISTNGLATTNYVQSYTNGAAQFTTLGLLTNYVAANSSGSSGANTNFSNISQTATNVILAIAAGSSTNAISNNGGSGTNITLNGNTSVNGTNLLLYSTNVVVYYPFSGIGLAIGLIPVMTATNAPSGNVLDSQQKSTAWQAFTTNHSDSFFGSSNNYWVTYSFPVATNVGSFTFSTSGSFGSANFSFQYSTDNVNWNTLYYAANIGGSTVMLTPTMVSAVNAQYFRWYFTSVSSSDIIVSYCNVFPVSDNVEISPYLQVQIQSTNGVAINTNSANGNGLEVNGNVDTTVGYTINGVPIGNASSSGYFINQQNGTGTNIVLFGTNFVSGTYFYGSNSATVGTLTASGSAYTSINGSYIAATNNGTWYTNSTGYNIVDTWAFNTPHNVIRFAISTNGFGTSPFTYPGAGGSFANFSLAGTYGSAYGSTGTVLVAYSSTLYTNITNIGVSINTNSVGTNTLEVNGWVDSTKGFSMNGFVGSSQTFAIQTNAVGPHGWTLTYTNGLFYGATQY